MTAAGGTASHDRDPHDLEWESAYHRAAAVFDPVPASEVALDVARGAVLAEPALARTDLPAATTSAMDGWAIAGNGPWRVIGSTLAGQAPSAELSAGQAIAIATGAVLPAGAQAVLRWEAAEEDGDHVAVRGPSPLPGTDVRPAGTECRRGDVVLEAGSRIGPAALGLLASAGLDRVAVYRVRADVLVLGDELLTSGPARDGLVRDALGPLLSSWLPARGVQIDSRTMVPDTREALEEALAGCSSEVVVTTGSTARGPVDHLHAVLSRIGARLVVDGVAVRPGHPQLLAVLPDGRPLVGLPGNPLAAVSGLLTLFDPLSRRLRGLGAATRIEATLEVDVAAGPDATRLMPVIEGRPALFTGPAMLRGLAAASQVAVVPPGGVRAGQPVRFLSVP